MTRWQLSRGKRSVLRSYGRFRKSYRTRGVRRSRRFRDLSASHFHHWRGYGHTHLPQIPLGTEIVMLGIFSRHRERLSIFRVSNFESYRLSSVVAIKNKRLMKKIPSSTKKPWANGENIFFYNTKIFSHSQNVEL
jgi:hypothetical protein